MRLKGLSPRSILISSVIDETFWIHTVSVARRPCIIGSEQPQLVRMKMLLGKENIKLLWQRPGQSRGCQCSCGSDSGSRGPLCNGMAIIRRAQRIENRGMGTMTFLKSPGLTRRSLREVAATYQPVIHLLISPSTLLFVNHPLTWWIFPVFSWITSTSVVVLKPSTLYGNYQGSRPQLGPGVLHWTISITPDEGTTPFQLASCIEVRVEVFLFFSSSAPIPRGFRCRSTIAFLIMW